MIPTPLAHSSAIPFAAHAAKQDGAVLVVVGPTASGKSGLALAIAQACDGTIINADSMQMYRELSIVTARPGPEAEAQVPHRLYGALPAAEVCSAARWRTLALDAIAAAHAQGRLPVVVGGTGLYVRALMEGLSEIPEIAPEVRATARERLAVLGAAGLHADLGRRDAETAARLRPGDSQRIVRAWEVLEATGRSLSDWQRAGCSGPPAGLRFSVLVLDPPRPDLYAACDGRLRAMVAAGALDEVRALVALGLDAGLPVMKALGVPEFRRHLEGGLPLDQAVAAAQQATRRYAKRQVTWFRHQVVDRAAECGPLVLNAV